MLGDRLVIDSEGLGGRLEGDIVEPASSDTATVSIAIGSALTGVDAVDDAVSTKRDKAVTGDLLVNDCDQTNSTPANPQNVTAALSTPPTNGTAVVNADGTFGYKPADGFVGTDTFSYTIVTIDAGQPRTDTATVTVTVTAASGGGPDNVVPIGLAGGALLLVGSSL